MSKPLIQVENLSKAYRIGLKEEIPDSLIGAVTGWMKAPLRNWKRLRSLNTFGKNVESPVSRLEHTESANGDNPQSNVASQPSALSPKPPDDIVWALKDVSFDVHEGEVVGIIGRNGAGKSTLLKILSRITEPTNGRAVIRGRVSSLLEVGTGFHPELTGRENIYMNGTILGMTKREIDRKFDEIVEFSGVERFLDTPIKRYSSGMKVRLAFAVAAHLDPEILIIDEVLAVGDAEFQKKCLGKMQDVAASGRTVLFVSHNMGAVLTLCTRCVVLLHGTAQCDTSPQDAIHKYAASDVADNAHALYLSANTNESPMPLNRIEVTSRGLHSPQGYPLGAPLEIRFYFHFSTPSSKPLVGLGIEGPHGDRIATLWSDSRKSRAAGPEVAGDFVLECVLEDPLLAPSDYFLKVALHSVEGEQHVLDPALRFSILANEDATFANSGRGLIVCRHRWKLL